MTLQLNYYLPSLTKISNLIMYGKWTDCQHIERRPTRGYHSECKRCGVEFGR